MQEDQQKKVIWTIGHSTHTVDEFLVMLQSFQIETLADIRRFPGSRRYPHFNKDALEVLLSENNIKYTPIVELGGRRKARPDSKNTGWRLAAFKGALIWGCRSCRVYFTPVIRLVPTGKTIFGLNTNPIMHYECLIPDQNIIKIAFY